MIVVFDLDDTLYDEIDFVKSGFSEVSKFLSFQNHLEIFEELINEFEINGSGKIFDTVIEKLKIKADIKKLIEIYRFHTPKIELSDGANKVLQELKSHRYGLITDGHYVTQKNKFMALGLEGFIEYPIFTDALNTKKPDTLPFKKVMEYFGENESYLYLADNPKKDFYAPDELGWTTIRYKNPRGIYKDEPNSAQYEIECLIDALSYIKEPSNG